VPLLSLPQALVPVDVRDSGRHDFFRKEELTRLNGRPSVTWLSKDRPGAAGFCDSELPLAKTLETLAADGRSPVYVVHFTQLEAARSAQDFTA